jgi:ribA/ribD-fused uncharacterized protein
MTEAITKFSGEYHFLSNFFPASIVLSFLHEGKRHRFIMPSVENAYQASKIASSTPDRVVRVRAFVDFTAGEAKRVGRSVDLRKDWEKIKIPLMHAFLRQKFSHPNLREKLLATGDAKLIEGNFWNDCFWGVDSKTGLGDNHLGKTLMRVRSELCST